MRRLSQFATQKGKAGKGPCGRISAGIRSPRTGRKPGRGEQQQPGQGAGVAPGRKAVRETRQPLLDGLEKGCDEYWILFSRQRRRRIERKRYEVSAGDGVATGMGHHHDFPPVHEPVRAVYSETTMEGEKRRGHP